MELTDTAPWEFYSLRMAGDGGIIRMTRNGSQVAAIAGDSAAYYGPKGFGFNYVSSLRYRSRVLRTPGDPDDVVACSRG